MLANQKSADVSQLPQNSYLKRAIDGAAIGLYMSKKSDFGRTDAQH